MPACGFDTIAAVDIEDLEGCDPAGAELVLPDDNRTAIPEVGVTSGRDLDGSWVDLANMGTIGLAVRYKGIDGGVIWYGNAEAQDAASRLF